MKFKEILMLTILLIGVAIFASGNNKNNPLVQEPTIDSKRFPYSQAQLTEDDKKKIYELRGKPNGIEQIAKLYGKYIESDFASDETSIDDIDTLTKKSEVVVSGYPIKNKCRIVVLGNPEFDKETIVTEYSFKIEKVLKGAAKDIGDVALGKVSVNQTIKASFSGGRVVFDNGAYAEIRRNEGKKMVNGKKYLLFLINTKHVDPSSKIDFIPTSEQGVFEIPVDGSNVNPYGSPRHGVVRIAAAMSPDKFLDDIRQAALKWPEYEPCCGGKETIDELVKKGVLKPRGK